MHHYTQKESFQNLIQSNRNQIVFTNFRWIWNQTDVRLVQINQNMVNTILFRVNLIRFQKDFSVCGRADDESSRPAAYFTSSVCPAYQISLFFMNSKLIFLLAIFRYAWIFIDQFDIRSHLPVCVVLYAHGIRTGVYVWRIIYATSLFHDVPYFYVEFLNVKIINSKLVFLLAIFRYARIFMDNTIRFIQFEDKSHLPVCIVLGRLVSRVYECAKSVWWIICATSPFQCSVSRCSVFLCRIF